MRQQHIVYKIIKTTESPSCGWTDQKIKKITNPPKKKIKPGLSLIKFHQTRFNLDDN